MHNSICLQCDQHREAITDDGSIVLLRLVRYH